MTIHEIEAQFKFGPIKVGKKLGDPVPNHGAFASFRKIHSNTGEASVVRFLYKVPIVNIPVAWWTDALHNFRIATRQPEEVKLKGGELYCHDCNDTLTRDEINNHPFVSKILHWVEN